MRKVGLAHRLRFSDALGDPKYQIDYASLLDFPAASIRAYSPATVIAEKFHAVVALGIANSRMKDFYDLWTLPKAVKIDSQELVDRSGERSTGGKPLYQRLVR